MTHPSTTSPSTLAEFASFEDAVLDGFANALASSPSARLPYWYEHDANVPIPDGVVPITVGTYPDLGRRASVTLNEYPVSDDPSLSDSVVGVQAAIWATNPRERATIVSDLFDRVHGAHSATMGAVTLVMAVRSTGANVGQDSNERLGRTENYYLTVHRPSPNRT